VDVAGERVRGLSKDLSKPGQARLKNVLPLCIVQVPSSNLPVRNGIILVPCSPIQLPSARAKSPRTSELQKWSVMRDPQCCVCMYANGMEKTQFVAVNRRSRSSACQPFPEHGISFLCSVCFGNCRHLSGSFNSSLAPRLLAPTFHFLCIPPSFRYPSKERRGRPDFQFSPAQICQGRDPLQGSFWKIFIVPRMTVP